MLVNSGNERNGGRYGCRLFLDLQINETDKDRLGPVA